MKEVTVSLWEITKEEALKLPPWTQILIYNSLLGVYRVEWIDDNNCIVWSKSVPEHVRFFSFEEPPLEGVKK